MNNTRNQENKPFGLQVIWNLIDGGMDSKDAVNVCGVYHHVIEKAQNDGRTVTQAGADVLLAYIRGMR